MIDHLVYRKENIDNMELETIGVKERIINVALEEFAQNGYKAASTNMICKKANI